MTEPMHKTPRHAKTVWAPAGNNTPGPERIAIVGAGPRAISVIERIAAKLAGKRMQRPLMIYAIDSVEVGCGRIWRTDQPDWFVMNTRSRNATMFPNAPDEGAWRPGYGPTFDEWWRQIDVNYPGPTGLAPRGLYGKYLKFVLDVIEVNLPEHVHLKRVEDFVVDIAERGDEYVLKFATGRDALHADRLILCSGYPDRRMAGKSTSIPSSGTRHLTAFDVLQTFHCGLSLPANLSGRVVGLRGLGLTFYDVLSELTIGRGGKYVYGDGTVKYVPSGREPELIVGGSRSGFPLPMRGRADRPADLAFVPHFFSKDRVAQIRAAGPACFRSAYLPWISAEVNLVYIEKILRSDLYRQFCGKLDASNVTSDTVMRVMSELARPYGIDRLLDLEALAAPFKGVSFGSQAEFRRTVVAAISDDVARSERGEFADPVKAALDVLRPIRPLIRKAVDLGGLTRASHHEFITKIAPTIAFLSTGPAPARAKQLLALIECGKVELLGPSVSFRSGEDSRVIASSDMVADYSVGIDLLIDAYVPAPNVDEDENPAIRSLADAGMLKNFMGVGGVEVTAKPFHPVASNGEVKDRIHVLGIPTESARWFLHVGLVEPGVWDEFIDDADSIAAMAVERLVPGEQDGPAPEGGWLLNRDVDPHKYLS
jgi:uncharacterized NAD(P)/FAD-binding protein YdhS